MADGLDWTDDVVHVDLNRPLTPGVRRFRLAQLRLEGREVPRSQRFEHLKRAHD